MLFIRALFARWCKFSGTNGAYQQHPSSLQVSGSHLGCHLQVPGKAAGLAMAHAIQQHHPNMPVHVEQQLRKHACTQAAVSTAAAATSYQHACLCDVGAVAQPCAQHMGGQASTQRTDGPRMKDNEQDAYKAHSTTNLSCSGAGNSQHSVPLASPTIFMPTCARLASPAAVAAAELLTSPLGPLLLLLVVASMAGAARCLMVDSSRIGRCSTMGPRPSALPCRTQGAETQEAQSQQHRQPILVLVQVPRHVRCKVTCWNAAATTAPTHQRRGVTAAAAAVQGQHTRA